MEAGELFYKNNDYIKYKKCLQSTVNLLLKKDIDNQSEIIIKKLIDIYIECGDFSKLAKLYFNLSNSFENTNIDDTTVAPREPIFPSYKKFKKKKNNKKCSKIIFS